MRRAAEPCEKIPPAMLFDTPKRVVFFDYPLYLNVGDLLIQLGAEQFFAENRIHVWKRYSAYDMPASIRGMDDDVVIICHGGGNFGDLYPIFQNGRERVLRLYPRNRIVILPQTVHFRSRERFLQSMEQFRSHGNCYIFARDNRSLEFLRQASFTQTSAMPDMAHYLWGKLLPITPRAYEAQPLRFVRRDGEAKASPLFECNPGTVLSYDWPDTTTDLKLLPITPRAYEAQPLRFVRRDGEAKASPLFECNPGTVLSYDWPDTTTDLKLLPITPRAYEAQPLRFVRRDGEAKASPLFECNPGTVLSYDWPDTT